MSKHIEGIVEKGKWTFRGTPGKAVAYIVVLALIGALLGLLVGKAVAAPEPVQRQVQVKCATQDSGACRTPTRKAKRFNRKFHHGKLGNANGFSPKRLFAKPKASRRIIVRRIARMLRASRAAGSARMAQSGGFHLRARGIYTNMVSDTPCSTPFNSSQFRATTGPFIPRNCNMIDASQFVSKENVVKALSVTACGGGVAVTLLTPVGRAAGRALKFWGATFQMTSCVTGAMLMGME